MTVLLPRAWEYRSNVEELGNYLYEHGGRHEDRISKPRLAARSHVLGFLGMRFAYGNWGDLGVCSFFVHTSLVLTQSIAHQEPGPLFMPFMIRRCFRIYPLAVVVLSTVVLFRIPQATIAPGHFTTWNYDWIDVLVNLTLVQGLTSGGRAESIIGPFWSLSYEMQMYVLLPLLFVLVNRKRRAIAIAAMCLTVLLVSLTICRYFPLSRSLLLPRALRLAWCPTFCCRHGGHGCRPICGRCCSL